MNSLFIIIPVYNEEKYKRSTKWMVKIVPKYFKKKYKFLIINDGSTDKTHQEIKKLKVIQFFILNKKYWAR